MGYDISEDRFHGGSIVGVRRQVDFASDDIGSCIGDAYGEVYGVLGAGAGSGHNVIVYQPNGETTAEMLVGCELDGPAPEGLVGASLPTGRVAKTRHVGPYHELPQAHWAIHTWMRERGHTTVGANWEIYGDWNDDPSKLVTDVYYLLPD